MDDPVAAARSLGDEVPVAEGTYDVPAGDLPPDPDDDWVAAGALVRSPSGDRIALVRTHWSGEAWVLPGGGVEPEDESLAATARREVEEETGLDVVVEAPLLVERQTLVDAGDPSRRTTGWFVLFDCTSNAAAFGGSPGEDDEEILAVGWFDDPIEAFEAPSENVRAVVADEVR